MTFEDLVKEYNDQFEDGADFIDGDETGLLGGICEGGLELDDGEDVEINIIREEVVDFDVDKCSLTKDIIFTVDDKNYYHVQTQDSCNNWEGSKVTLLKCREEQRTVKVLTFENQEYLV